MNPEEIHEQLPMSRLSTDESPGRPNTSTVSAYESQLEISMISANEDDDAEVSLWIDEKEQQHEKRGVINHAISQLTEGRYSPIASTLKTSCMGGCVGYAAAILSTQGERGSSSGVIGCCSGTRSENVELFEGRPAGS